MDHLYVRLRELDDEVERLRAALAALQHHLRERHAGAAAPGRPPRRRDDEFLRAYA